MTYRCTKCGGTNLVPTPESNYQEYKCVRCGNVSKVVYKKDYMDNGQWGHGIG